MEPLVATTEGFGLNNLPWGVFTSSSAGNGRPRIGVALGDYVVDACALFEAGLFPGPILSQLGGCMSAGSLNSFMSLGTPAWAEARTTLQRLLSSHEGTLRDDGPLRKSVLLPKASVNVHPAPALLPRLAGTQSPSSRDAQCNSSKLLYFAGSIRPSLAGERGDAAAG